MKFCSSLSLEECPLTIILGKHFILQIMSVQPKKFSENEHNYNISPQIEKQNMSFTLVHILCLLPFTTSQHVPEVSTMLTSNSTGGFCLFNFHTNKACSMYCWVVGFFHWALYLWDSWYCTGSSSFIFIVVYCSIVWIYHDWFIHSPADKHLGYFQFRPAMNHAAKNILIHHFWWAYVYVPFYKYPGTQLLGHRVSPCLALVDISKMFSKMVVQKYTPISSVWEFWLLQMFFSIWYCLSFSP